MYNMERITEEIVKELDKLEFVQKPNFKHYDYVSLSGEYLELFKDETFEKVVSADGENYEYKIVNKSQTRRFRNNNFDSVFVEY